MLQGEYQISQNFKTETKSKLGLPKHTVIMTNRRMIVSCKQRFLFCFKHEWETSVLYKCAFTYVTAFVSIAIMHCRIVVRVCTLDIGDLFQTASLSVLVVTMDVGNHGPVRDGNQKGLPLIMSSCKASVSCASILHCKSKRRVGRGRAILALPSKKGVPVYLSSDDAR
jgi:hypothetical protein